MFAEWHESDVADVDGVSDTGPTLRAFLPFADGQARSSVQTYSGEAVVLDSRVMCMRPHLSNLTFFSYMKPPHDHPTISLSVNIPDEFTRRPATTRASWRFKPGTVIVSPLNCSTPTWLSYLDFYHKGDSLLSFCQLPHDLGSIVSEFFDLDSGKGSNEIPSDSTNYLAIDMQGPPETPDGGDNFDYTELFGDATPTRTETKDEWVHIYFNSTAWPGNFYEYRVSFSLCFASLNAINMPILASSARNRTEPVPSVKNGTYSFTDIRKQLGQEKISTEDRGVMKLHGADWVAHGAKSDNVIEYIQQSGAGMTAIASRNKPGVNFIRYGGGPGASAASPDISQIVQEALRNGSRVNFVLQSLMTILAGMAYYDQVPIFDLTSQATQTVFTNTQVPGGEHSHLGSPAGFRIGYTIVMSMLAIHCVLVTVISWFFFKRKFHGHSSAKIP